jgi:hypothetical protein
VIPTRVRRYLFTHCTPEILLNVVFEDLRTPKAPNRVHGILEFNSFLAGTGYPTGKNTRAGTSMGKILYPRVYMGNPTGRIFLMGTGIEWYYPTGMYPLPSLHAQPL